MLLEVVDEGDQGEQNDGDGFEDGFQGNVSSLMFLRESRPGSLDDRNRGEV
jgi:hypothetical protein